MLVLPSNRKSDCREHGRLPSFTFIKDPGPKGLLSIGHDKDLQRIHFYLMVKAISSMFNCKYSLIIVHTQELTSTKTD